MRAIVLLLCALVLGISALTAYSILENRKSHHALCDIRVLIEGDVKRAEKFLENNPKGIPGVPVVILREGINDDKRTLEALNKLDC